MKLAKILVLVLVFISFSKHAVTQSKSQFHDALFLEYKNHYGFVLAHHRYIMHLSKAHFLSHELCLDKKTIGDKTWHAYYNYPSIGLVYYYSNLGKSEYLGEAHGIFPYIKGRVIAKNKFNTNFRGGIGLGYISKPYHYKNNYKNVAISTHVNILVSMLLEQEYSVNKQLNISANLGLTHFSNGSLKTPNLGINIPAVGVGVKYKINQQPIIILRNYDTTKLYKKNEWVSVIALGQKEIYPPAGNKYWFYNTQFNWNRIISPKRKVFAAFDLTYNTANIEKLRRDSIEWHSHLEIFRPGIGIGHEWCYGKLSFTFLTGYYIYTKDKNDGNIYSRIALRYPNNKKIMPFLGLKTHFFKADGIEWGLAYRWN